MNHSFNTTVAELYGLQEAILLENIYFWCKKNEANNKLTEGEPWTYNTVKAFNTQFKYLSPAVITRALKNLEKEGLIKISEFNTNAYDHTKWYCITDKCRKYFEDESSKKEPESHPENKKSICDFSKSKTENRNSITKKEQILMTDITTDDKPNINSDTPSPQPSESSDKDSLPQEENSKSHYEPFSPSKEILSDSEFLPKRKRNSKSHCGSATESEEFKKQVQEIKLLYLNNYHTLFKRQRVTLENPAIIWSRTINKIKESITNFGFELVKKVLTLSVTDKFCVETGYVLTTVLSDSVFSRLSQTGTRPNNQFSSARSYQQPRQFDESHLIF